MLPNGARRGRNSKLETFLKKKLKPGVYGDIRWYEPVVLRRDASLAYKQVVVTGEEILLIDTPPKDITTLLSINSITAVLMVHDLPEFLEGGLRDRTTHILLKVRNEEKFKNLKHKARRGSTTSSKASSSRRGSSQSALSEEASQEFVNGNEHEVNHITSCTKSKTSKWKQFMARRCSSKELMSFSKSDIDKLYYPKDSHLKLSTKNIRPPLIRTAALSEEHTDRPQRLSYAKLSIQTPEFRHSMSETSPEGPGLSPLMGVKRESMSRPISPALCEVLSRVDSKTFQYPCRSATPDFTTRQKIPRSISAMENYYGHHFAATYRSKSVLDKPLNLISSNTLPKREDPTESSVDLSEFSEEEDEVHLYTLSTSTHLFHLLHSLWMASLLVTYSELSSEFPTNSDVQLNEEGIDQTFKSLCSDLRRATSVKDHSDLLQDLLQGIRKYSTVRRTFWRDTEALSLMRQLMKSYNRFIPNDHANPEDGVIEQRENELKVIILSLEVLENSLSRSQGCPFKNKTLNSKVFLQELLKEIFTVPAVPPHHNLMCKRFLTNFKELSEGAWQALPERELLMLVQETIQTSVAAAYYLIEAIFEIGWSDETREVTTHVAKKNNDATSLNVLLQYVKVDKWLSYAMPQLLLLVQSKSRDVEGILAREDVILIYQFLAVLLALLKKSPKALAFCIANYSEELRYYVNESVLKRKFDSLDPLTPHSFRLAKSISKLVLR